MARRIPVLSGIMARLDALRSDNDRLRQLVADLARPPMRTGTEPVNPDALARDGLPLPPPALRYWVTGGTGADGFLELGGRGAETVRAAIRRHGAVLGGIRAVLDFGCGSGRVIRYLRDDGLELHGTDCNRAAVAWCDEHLDFAIFGSNRLAPPTRYRSAGFDLVYAFSVFTHLPERLQHDWIEELRRIIRPGGGLLLSTHGAACAAGLPSTERARFERGELVVVSEADAGLNSCGLFHPDTYVRCRLLRGFTVLEHQPAGALGNPPQDLYVLQRI